MMSDLSIEARVSALEGIHGLGPAPSPEKRLAEAVERLSDDVERGRRAQEAALELGACILLCLVLWHASKYVRHWSEMLRG